MLRSTSGGTSRRRRRVRLGTLVCLSAVIWAATALYAFALTHHALECDLNGRQGGGDLPIPSEMRGSAKAIVRCETFIDLPDTVLASYRDGIDPLRRGTGGRREFYFALGQTGGYLHFTSIGGTITHAEITSTIPSP